MDEKILTIAKRVIAALRGDTDSYKVLFDEAAPYVWEICKKYFLDDADAKTALESTFGTVAEKFADQKDPTDFLGWVKRIAHLTCAEQAAKVGGLADAEVKDLALLTLSDYKKEKKDGVLTFATVKDLTEKILGVLPQRQKTELLLWNEGYSVAEIAKKLGISPGSVVGGLNIAKGKVEEETGKWEADGFDYTKYAASPMSFFTRLMREKFDGDYIYALPEDKGWTWTSIWDGLKGTLKWPALGVGAAAATGLVSKFGDLDLDLPGFDWKAKLADAKIDLPDVDLKAPDVELPKVDVDLPKVDVDAKLPDVDLPKVDVDAKLPDVDVDVKKPDIDLGKVGAGVAAGAAAVGAAAAKLKDVDVDLPKVDVDLPDVDLKAKAADIKADIDAKLPDIDLKKDDDDKAAAVAAAAGKKKGLAGCWKWLLPLLLLLLLLGLIFGGLKGCNTGASGCNTGASGCSTGASGCSTGAKGCAKGDADIKTPDVSVKTPDFDVNTVESGDLDAYVIDADVKTKTVPVSVDGSVLDINTNDVGRFLCGLNVVNTNPAAYVIAQTSDAKSLVEKYAYVFPSVPEILDGTLTELKFTDGLGAKKSFQFETKDGVLSKVTLADKDGAIETATYNWDNGTLKTVTVGDKTLDYLKDVTPTKSEKDEANGLTKVYFGDNWITCRDLNEEAVDLITYEWDNHTGARAFAYDDNGALKTYSSFQSIMK
jgi:DNA-directed RNA polymerase specialized sigma subunit, sigma24 homolog